MEFLILGYDGSDAGAPQRRLDARPAHLERMKTCVANGTILYGAAILDDGGAMIGSSLVCDFATRDELDAWLEADPYTRGGVWKKIEVRRCRPGPGFERTATA